MKSSKGLIVWLRRDTTGKEAMVPLSNARIEPLG